MENLTLLKEVCHVGVDLRYHICSSHTQCPSSLLVAYGSRFRNFSSLSRTMSVCMPLCCTKMIMNQSLKMEATTMKCFSFIGDIGVIVSLHSNRNLN